ncbi:methyltransferase domain-containing protein [Amycolatopsis sp. CA-230715]|uniref:methyltransferase domain-containing protein n=1 Tax=Amycolatopsis sp. CA-230715 TaxID=2745196 RepID=UPI001C012D08|nr:methyltransferase domain-containing protein [Amycolatopsis sp. CA-230715]QWF81755.1 Protein-L-isoaspartate O-methyltransferase [Amycolatopsis sp. CA-230715]
MTTARIDALIDELRSAGNLPAEFGSLLHEVPREKFVPARAWRGDTSAPIDRVSDPGEWSEVVYSNTQIVIQFDDGAAEWPDVGRLPTCSNSMPSVVLGMFDALGARKGEQVLEIGTGTGWTGAMLGRIVGPEGRVVSMEIDHQLAGQARERIDRAGFHQVRVLQGDGAAGAPELAPFHRVISTMAVQLGRVPYAWVKQTKPGGTIVTPVRADLSSGPLVRFTVHGDGTATGRMLPMGVGFMEHRLDRAAVTAGEAHDWEDESADRKTTKTKPWLMLSDFVSRWALAVALPSCRYDMEEGRLAWLADPLTGSWATIVPSSEEGQFLVRQKGIRRLWDEAETAYRWWIGAGQPTGLNWLWTITPDRQTIEIA